MRVTARFMDPPLVRSFVKDGLATVSHLLGHGNSNRPLANLWNENPPRAFRRRGRQEKRWRKPQLQVTCPCKYDGVMIDRWRMPPRSTV